jgi:serine/threonine-protein kinase HipA
MNRELLVHIDVGGEPVPCGRLWTRGVPRESASFEYAPSWIGAPRSFALEPELPLTAGQFHTGQALFRAFLDPAPDRWGQTLLRRSERARAKREKHTPRSLGAVDFLALVDDETRLGALRFRDATAGTDSPFLTTGVARVPPLLALPKLLAATARILDDRESDEDLALVLAPGTSLGGARPKASVRDTGGGLLVAKFPAATDEWPITRWEAVTLEMAQASGILVAPFRLAVVAGKPVLLEQRFDREGKRRIPFMSAMTALSAVDGEMHSYLGLVDVLRREGSQAAADLCELWRRLVFNVVVSNTDDHLRNHGFLRDSVGWRLAPAYDLNPMPVDVRPRVHALALDDGDPSGSMETVFEVAPRFGLRATDARKIARKVAASVRRWRAVAKKRGLRPREIDRMESAFEHEDLALAAK